MPIKKYRDVSEMQDNTWRAPGDPELFRAIKSVWEFSARVSPRRFPPGVYKHRCIEDAQRLRAQWERDNARRGRAT